jgi:hypothetical protein
MRQSNLSKYRKFWDEGKKIVSNCICVNAYTFLKMIRSYNNYIYIYLIYIYIYEIRLGIRSLFTLKVGISSYE